MIASSLLFSSSAVLLARDMAIPRLISIGGGKPQSSISWHHFSNALSVPGGNFCSCSSACHLFCLFPRAWSHNTLCASARFRNVGGESLVSQAARACRMRSSFSLSTFDFQIVWTFPIADFPVVYRSLFYKVVPEICFFNLLPRCPPLGIEKAMSDFRVLSNFRMSYVKVGIQVYGSGRDKPVDAAIVQLDY